MCKQHKVQWRSDSNSNDWKSDKKTKATYKINNNICLCHNCLNWIFIKWVVFHWNNLHEQKEMPDLLTRDVVWRQVSKIKLNWTNIYYLCHFTCPKSPINLRWRWESSEPLKGTSTCEPILAEIQAVQIEHSNRKTHLQVSTNINLISQWCSASNPIENAKQPKEYGLMHYPTLAFSNVSILQSDTSTLIA